MADKVQLIKEEIKRRIGNLSYLIPDVSNIGNLTKEDVGYFAKSEALKSILQYINALPEEHNKDLEKAAIDAWNNHVGLELMHVEEVIAFANEISEWQKRQMMKDAISFNVDWSDGFRLDYTQEQQDDVLLKLEADVGDKVKIIILKTEQP